jgi:CheY-like chemotaxis protein
MLDALPAPAILIVDDDTELSALLVRVLTAEGWTVSTAPPAPWSIATRLLQNVLKRRTQSKGTATYLGYVQHMHARWPTPWSGAVIAHGLKTAI